ncbi:hypothetical protein ABAC460_01975 [Asticcacaulis sp. AC460]|uniref:hypothetical protein n=1 Tax=Asticcacaulis sp. AC460 TaxID=1282360 RepID=UPI0003C3C524|nr:hypothetical protein [Asticcacaulis sp. AC460]ESQ93045.1 hypothetical protein ABAC460_01975 [Asticcacaulis sp. AC460]
MSDETTQTAPAPLAGVWLIMALVLTAFIFATNSNNMTDMVTRYPGSTGGFAATCQSWQACTIVEVAPGGPADRAGLKAGDTVRFDRATDVSRWPAVGEKIGLTVHAGDTLRPIDVKFEKAEWPPEAEQNRAAALVAWVISLIGPLVAIFVLARSGRRRSVFVLGLALACNSLTSATATTWFNAPVIFPMATVLTAILYSAIPLLFLLFARYFRRETAGRDGPLAQWTTRIYAILMAVATAADVFNFLFRIDAPVFGGGFLTSVLAFPGFGLALATLFAGWRDSTPEMRPRYVLLLVAVALISFYQVLAGVIFLTRIPWLLTDPLIVAAVVMPTAGLFLFAYAVLRERVLDIGFAINRTVVYTVLSIILLTAFGITEWLVGQLTGLLGVKANVLMDAGVALLIFFAFHNIQGFVEKSVETFLFRKWHDNEARLKRFMVEAGFVHTPDALEKATVTELTRFSGGAGVAIYRVAGRDYLRTEDGLSGAPEQVDSDLPGVVRMRADRVAVEGELLRDVLPELEGGLALPMLYRADVSGFVLLGPKPSGELYRPDEREALEAAIRKIGLDLHALRVEELEQEAAGLRQRAEVLESQIQQALMTSPPVAKRTGRQAK